MKHQVITSLIEKGFLISPDLTDLSFEELNPFLEYIDIQYSEKKPTVLSNKIYTDFIKYNLGNKEEQEPKQEQGPEPFIIERHTEKREAIETKIKIRKNYVQENKKVSINDWIAYYFDRYNRMRDLLQNREELKNTISIGRALKSSSGGGRQKVSLIGMVKEIRKAFSGTWILELEDPTGTIRASLKRPELIPKAEEIVEDEVIGITGTISNNFVYAESIVFPEIPERPIKKAPDEVYSVFLSDIHVGSNMFLSKEFTQCINWISGEIGNKQQKDIAKKIRYLFIAGDLVDGVGIYPGQEKELIIKDIFRQYQEIAGYLSKIPDDIQIVVVPGNHDTVRLAEPQPALFKDIAESLYKLPNITMASNPSTFNIHNIGNFPGLDVLMYHGYSFDHYVANTPSLLKHGYNRADLIQELLLRKRHLAPTHGSSQTHPTAHDFMIIDKVPDIFVTGHIHKSKVGRYKNVLNLNCGCFQDKTSFQEKVGHDPEPGKVPVLNLQTSEVKLMRFK